MKNIIAFENLDMLFNRYHYLCIMSGLFGLSIISRVLFQGIPSVDPLLPIILYAGAKSNPRDALLFGASTYYISNFFVIGGQGWWSIPMVIGAGVVGLSGSLLKNRKLFAITISTVIYEILVNISWAIVFGFGTIISAIPFSLTHIVSNMAFVGGFIAMDKHLTRHKQKRR